MNEVHAVAWRDCTLADILRRMRPDGCGGRAGRVELLTGIDGVSSQPVRRIVLITHTAGRADPVVSCRAGRTKQFR
jgi:hypothetical protein